ncbi:MAG: DUF4388 domain-containing protein [Deltaproteobacteria bacterium]|nr:DUF4388 domain-containing protein [Deltaproteobacteria bacterium]MCL5277715.1 DUF4388 domain-containing protein [Deltaproteobacteria bacterium]
MKQHQLLIVTWLSDITSSVSQILKNNNYVFDSVSTPIEAINAIGKHAYKIVVLDSLLPGVNGYQLVKRLKSEPHGEYTKFVVLMNNIPRDRYDDVNRRWNIYALLKKPLKSDELLQVIKNAEAYDLPSEKLEMHSSESVEATLSELAGNLWTGKTTCYGKNGTVKEIYWDSGNPVFAMSSDENDRLDKWLLKTEQLTEDVLMSAYEIMDQRGKRLEDALLMLGAISEDNLETAISDSMTAIILDLFSWDGMEYTKEEKETGMKMLTSIKDSFPIILFEGIKRNTDIKGIKNKLESEGEIVGFIPDNIFNVEDFKFPHAYNRIVNLINGRRTIYELIAKSGLSQDDAYRFIYTLFLLKLIRLSAPDKEEKSAVISMPTIQRDTNKKTRFTGTLNDISIVELIQMLELNRKSGALQINDSKEIGWILFDKGKIVDAYYGDLTRLNAVYRILFLTEGEFEIKFKDIIGESRIDADVQTLLMEGLRLVDEIKRIGPMLGNLEKGFIVNKSHKFNTEEEKDELMRIFNGRNDALTSAFMLNPDPQIGFDIMTTLLKNNVIEEGK